MVQCNLIDWLHMRGGALITFSVTFEKGGWRLWI